MEEAEATSSGTAEEAVETPLPNLMELAFYFEQTGVGLGREELMRVWLGMKHLVERYPLQTVRFWGKVLGLEQNYHVVEAEFREGEEPEEQQAEEEGATEESVKEPTIGPTEGEEAEEVLEDTPPKPTWKATPTVPKEEKGAGCNRKIYFVCNERTTLLYSTLLDYVTT